MPTVSQNRLLVLGPRREVSRFVRFAGGDDLELGKLYPVPEDVEAAGDEEVMNWQTVHWNTKWDVWNVEPTTLFTTRSGLGRITYYFLTAWDAPVGAVVHASKSFPALCFVLAGVSIEVSPFESYLIHKGRVRKWEMPEEVADQVAELEDLDGQMVYAEYQPGVFRRLLSHWDEDIRKKLDVDSAQRANRK